MRVAGPFDQAPGGTVALRRIACLHYGDALAADYRQPGTVPVFASGGQVGWHNTANAKGPLVVVGRKGSYGSVHWVASDAFVIDTAFAAEPRTAVPRWLFYVLSVAHLRALSQDVGVPGLSRKSVHELRIPDFGVIQQAGVADFLDRECERIEALLSAKRSQRSEFEGLRSATVREASAHLSTRRLRHGWRVVDCKHRTPVYRDEGCPVISTREVRRGALDVSIAERFVSEDDARDLRDGGRDPRQGDIVFSRNATVGVASYVSGDELVCMGQDVVLITRRPRNSHLLSYFLNWGVADQVARSSLGSTFSRINVETIRELLVPCDTEDAEQSVMTYVVRAFDAIDGAEAHLIESERMLTEYRNALITETVTGKLDVTQLSDAQLDESAQAALEGEAPEVLAS